MAWFAAPVFLGCVPMPVNGLGVVLPPTPKSSLSAQDRLDGWLVLFDGATAFGWDMPAKADAGAGLGVLGAGEGVSVETTTRFGAGTLRFDYFLTPRGKASVEFQAQTIDLPVADPPAWRRLEATRVAEGWAVRLDGKTLPSPAIGSTDLARAPVRFRCARGRLLLTNIEFRPEGLEPLFNGKDLAGWRTHPKLTLDPSVNAAGELQIKNGRGQLETEAEFGDFVLQLQAKTNAPGLNSGVFVRCIPGDEMMGYELQIHHGFRDGDRTQPVDCGTGGVFRRVDARRVVADDLEWFAMTLVADGPRFAVWVNGEQVTDWTDDRPADENPRRGLRLAAGTVMLQGHDPTTDVVFRDLRAAELPRAAPSSSENSTDAP